MTRKLAEMHGLRFIDFSEVNISYSVVELIPASFAFENRVIALEESKESITVIIGDPDDYDTIEKLRFFLNRPVESQ